MGTERDDGKRPELPSGAVVPDEIIEPGATTRPGSAEIEREVGWANDAVVARFPSGTDPLDAVRESMDVFMERTDGTNALEWWQRAGVKWWHGGPSGRRRGQLILPPAKTGIVPTISSDPDSVYVTSDRAEAILYAATILLTSMPEGRRIGPSPALYQVTFTTAPIPDDTQPDSDTSFRVPEAKVYRVLGISRVELEQALDRLLEANRETMEEQLAELDQPRDDR